MKKKGVIGCSFIMLSGVLYSIERYLAVMVWSDLTRPVIERGNGSFVASPTMPKMGANGFVVMFLVLGFLLLLLDTSTYYIDKNLVKKEHEKQQDN